MLFWIVATILALTVAATLILPLLRGADAHGADDPATAIYRDQLAEVDRDLARGLLDAAEAERARTEIARRLLDADKVKGTATMAPGTVTRVAGGAAALLVVAGGLSLYWVLGAPGYPDIPRAQRIADSEAARTARAPQAVYEAAATEASPPIPDSALPEDTRALLEELRAVVPARPDDPRGWELLAGNEARLQNFAAAARAQEGLIAARGAAATVEDRAVLAGLMVSAAGGAVSPETEVLIRAILTEDEGNPVARFYMGALYSQTDRPDVAFRFWRDLAEQGRADNPYVQLARANVEDAAFRAGLDYTLPEAALRGPSAADVAAMSDLSPGDRAARIEGMVAQLSDRLATEGGPAEDWAQLITAYGVLGDAEQAEAIWREGMQVFAASPDALAVLSAAAERAGLSP